MVEIHVNLGANSYPIYIEKDLLKHAASYIQKQFPDKRIILISDDHVFPLYGIELKQQLSAFTNCSSLILPHGENTKNFQTLTTVYSAMLEAGITRSDLVIALGGGVIGDLTGFAAASFLRGVHFIQMPTSLLAQVDSSVGGKVAVDLPQGKNLVGAFYQPKMVFIDPSVLASLPERYIHDGMGEVIKYGCIKDAELFAQLQAHTSFQALSPILTDIIAKCVDIKRIVVEQDPFDKGERMLLNFGHTLAHTIEQYYQYERESHGEAVAIGMYQISCIAEEQGLSAPGTSNRILRVLEQYGLPSACGVSLKELLKAITLDKKNLNHHLNVILLREIGDSYIYPTTPAFFEKEGRIV